MAEAVKPISKVQLGKRAKVIREWISAYQTLVDLDVKYFDLSLHSKDKLMKKKYRQKSEQYHQAIDKLITLIP